MKKRNPFLLPESIALETLEGKGAAAYRMRRSNWYWRDIAAELGYSCDGAAFHAARRAAARHGLAWPIPVSRTRFRRTANGGAENRLSAR